MAPDTLFISASQDEIKEIKAGGLLRLYLKGLSSEMEGVSCYTSFASSL